MSASATPPFAVRSDSFALGPDASAVLAVRFEPRRARSYAGALVLRTNDPSRPRLRIALSGRGVR
ncbi:MAG: hypothetical protein ACRDNX_02345 [Gaiellaceae bacterium]